MARLRVARPREEAAPRDRQTPRGQGRKPAPGPVTALPVFKSSGTVWVTGVIGPGGLWRAGCGEKGVWRLRPVSNGGDAKSTRIDWSASRLGPSRYLHPHH